MRLFITALACLISVSALGEVIRADINHDGESDKTTLLPDSINQESLSIKIAGSGLIIGTSIDFEKCYKSSENRYKGIIHRYVFVKSNYTYVYGANRGSGYGALDLSGEDAIFMGIGIGRLRQMSANKFFDYSIGLSALIIDADVYPFPIFSLGIRKITKNNNIIKYGFGFPEFFHVGYGFTFSSAKTKEYR
jgi:hypothetical protein